MVAGYARVERDGGPVEDMTNVREVNEVEDVEETEGVV